MSYDVSEQAADDTSGWTAPTGPRHRYDPARAAGGSTGGFPAPPPSISAQLRPAPGWNGGTSGQPATPAAPAAPAAPSWTTPGSAGSEWLSPTAQRPATSASRPAVPEWVQTQSGEWVRTQHTGGDWAATASGEWQPVGRRRSAEPAAAGAVPSARWPGEQGGGGPGFGFGASPSGPYPQAQPPSGGGFWGPPADTGGPAPGTPGGWQPPAPPPEPERHEPVYRSHDPAAADLRSQVVRRIRFMNFRHAEHAWERRYRDPLGPHALAFLYAEPARGKPARHVLKTATRLFLAGPEVDDLPQLLGDLTAVVSSAAPGELDCRTLTDRTEDMSTGATYFGLAVSSLDTPAGRWADVRQQVAGSIDVPGRCYSLLSDGTMVLMDRGGRSRFGHFEVRSTDSLDEVPGDSLQRWTYDRSLAELSDPATYDVWIRLRGLHDAIVAGGHR